MTQRPDRAGFGMLPRAVLRGENRQYALQTQGGNLFVESAPIPGTQAPSERQPPWRRQVALVTGGHHFRVPWLDAGGGRLDILPFAYVLSEKRWVPRSAIFLNPPETKLPDTSPALWNVTCIHCHTTGSAMGLTPNPEVMFPKPSELGIGCEACHGPAARHVQLARQARADSRRTPPEGSLLGGIVNPGKISHQRATDGCGQCHSVWVWNQGSKEAMHRAYQEGFSFRPGAAVTNDPARRFVSGQEAVGNATSPLGNDFFKQRFWPDGMVRVSGREYNGLINSACYQRGQMSCSSCHRMHVDVDATTHQAWRVSQLRPHETPDGGCLSCHQKIQATLTAHTRHDKASPGSQCVNCHMPYTSFGLLKASRSHQVTSPNAKESRQAGRPNACNLCHLDRSIDWTESELAKRTTTTTGLRVNGPGALSEAAAGVVWTLAGDAGQRALVAYAMGWKPAQRTAGVDWMIPYLAELLKDDYVAVRTVAWRAVKTLPLATGLNYDYLADAGRRADVAQALVRRWQSESARKKYTSGAGRPALLIDARGVVDRKRYESLLAGRDRHNMALLE